MAFISFPFSLFFSQNLVFFFPGSRGINQSNFKKYPCFLNCCLNIADVKERNSSAMNREVLRFGIAFVSVVVIDTVRPTPQIVSVILSLLLEEKGMT